MFQLNQICFQKIKKPTVESYHKEKDLISSPQSDQIYVLQDFSHLDYFLYLSGISEPVLGF